MVLKMWTIYKGEREKRMDYSKNPKKKNGLKARLVALLLATGLVLTGLPAGQNA